MRPGRVARWMWTAAAAMLAFPSLGASAASQVRVRAGFDSGAVYLSDPGERYLEVEVIAPETALAPEEERGRPPLNIALVLDKSGSMAEANKLTFAKEAARAMVQGLRYGDRFALVTYDDVVSVPIPSEALEERDRALALIDGIRPYGSTNLGGGLLEGYRQVRRGHNPRGINRVLLLSDGLANRGITAPEELSRIASGEGGAGVSVSTFGVGLEFNEDLLASLAESGRGTYYYIDRPGRIGELLAREFSSLQRLCAADVEVELELEAEFSVSEFLGYRHRREGNRYFIQLGSLAAGEHRRVMARLAPGRRPAGEHRVGRVLLQYRPAGEQRRATASQELRLRWVDDRAAVSRSLDREVAERAAVYEANAARETAAKLVDRGDTEGARQVLDQNRQRLQAAPVQTPAVKDELRTNEAYGAAVAAPLPEAERAAVQKEIKYKSYRTLQQK